MPALNTCIKCFSLIFRAAVVGDGGGKADVASPGRDTGVLGDGGIQGICTVVEQGETWGLFLVWCSTVIGGLIKGVLLLQVNFVDTVCSLLPLIHRWCGW